MVLQLYQTPDPRPIVDGTDLGSQWDTSTGRRCYKVLQHMAYGDFPMFGDDSKWKTRELTQLGRRKDILAPLGTKFVPFPD